MAKNFNMLERYIAKVLSDSPKVKNKVKFYYQYFQFFINKKTYNKNIYTGIFSEINSERENFFGYYDKSPISSNGKYICYHSTLKDTSISPAQHSNLSCSIVVQDIESGSIKFQDITTAYNYQQGARLHWVDDSKIIFNYYDENIDSYRAKVVDVFSQETIHVCKYPVCDSFKREYYVSIDFDKLAVLRPDYGYFSRLKNGRYIDEVVGSIKVVNFENEEVLHEINLNDVLDNKKINKLKNKFNHIQISPSGSKFSFLHRYFDQNGRRYDNLYIYNLDNKKIKKIETGKIVSHLCWIESDMLFGFISDPEENVGFYYVNTETGNIIRESHLDGFSDGHPSFSDIDNCIFFDSYPDKSRMQNLYMFNIETKKIDCIANFLHPMRFYGETRCDLHPRVCRNRDNLIISCDTVYSNKRNSVLIDFKGIL